MRLQLLLIDDEERVVTLRVARDASRALLGRAPFLLLLLA